jgi:SAM-dependent methyltransferase
MFAVPEKFNRNAPDVVALGPPADVGFKLIEYMCERLEIPDLAGRDVLDFGCGVRFTDTIMNRNVPLRTYVGLEVDKEIVDFLSANATDPRLTFLHFDASNPLYNKGGVPLAPETSLPIGNRTFDVICMFSVITHQLPEDAGSIFAILRRYTRQQGRLFFSACLEEGDFAYREHNPNIPTALSIYTPESLTRLVETAGWKILSVVPRNPRGLPILDSFLCGPSG